MTAKSLPLVFSNFIIAALIALITAAFSLVIAQSAPASAFSVKVFNPYTGNGVADMTVTGVSENGTQIVSQQTDIDGMAHFTLSPGNWRFTTCNQSILYGSSEGNTASTWLVACYQSWLPVITN